MKAFIIECHFFGFILKTSGIISQNTYIDTPIGNMVSLL
jgi:hypothetical protein